MEFAPPSRGAKPITKSQLRKLQKQYAASWITYAKNLEAENEEREEQKRKLDDQIDLL